jgi:hypothetical protein
MGGDACFCLIIFRADTLHRFCKKEHDWGWKKFMELSKLGDGFLTAASAPALGGPPATAQQQQGAGSVAAGGGLTLTIKAQVQVLS